MMNIHDDGYIETLSLEEAMAYEGTYVIIEEDVQEDIPMSEDNV